MSGPKVVRVVTREELLARALDQISLLESAVARYATLGRRHDVNISAEIAAYRKVIAELKALAQSSAWDVIARRSSDTIRMVEHDRKLLEENLIAAATKDRTVRRRLKDAATAIQRELHAQNLAIPSALKDVIANADSATADQLKRMDAAVVAASRVLVQNTTKTKALDGALAKRLASGLNQENYTEWLASNAVREESQQAVRLDKIMAELQLRDFAVTEPVAAAIQRIQAAGDHERDLLTDSLTIELSDLLKAHRRRGEDVARLESHIARLEREESREAQDLVRILRTAISSDHAVDFGALDSRAEEFLKMSRANANALHQRKALLSGLTALGYEVREGMATALVVNGRLVVKKPAEVEYGVEIVSGAANGRLQVRMVSFLGASNPTRDKDTEIIWCGEFSQLQARLASAGHVLEIEKALAPGAAPMKHEQLPLGHEIDASVDVKQPQVRSV